MKINIDSFDIYPKVAFAGTRGSYGADAVLEFEFGESWKELSKSVIFYPADGSDAVSILLGSDTTVKIPFDVMSVAGQAKYVVSGVKGEDIMISVTGDLHVAQTLDAAGTEPDAVVPSLAMQVISKVTDAERAATEAKEAAEQCGALIEEYVIDTESARVSAENAKESADEAQRIKNETEEIKDMFVSEEEQRQLDEAVRVENEGKRERAEAVRAENYSRLSNALVGRASGGAVRCEVSPIEHELDVNLSGGNLMPYPYQTNAAEIDGLSFAYNERTVSVEGVSNNAVLFTFGTKNIEAGRYTVGGFALSSTGGRVQFRIKGAEKTESCNIITGGESLDAVTFDVAENIDNAELQVYFSTIDETVSGTMTPYLVKGDMSGVKLLQYGKNLFSFDDIYGNLFEKQADGSYKSTVRINGTNFARDFHLPPAVYTMSYYLKCPVGANYRFEIYYEDGGKARQYHDSTGEYKYFEFTTDGRPIKQMKLDHGNAALGDMQIYLKDVQIEVGSVATEYELYIEPTEYTANADGTVDGVMSVYPTTTLMTDTDGVTVDATYNKDANKVVASLEERIAALEAK